MQLSIAGAWIPILHGYQSPEHGYQSQGHGYQTPGSTKSPGHGYQTPTDGNDILVCQPNHSSSDVGHQILQDDILLTGELLDQNISAIRMIEVGFYGSPKHAVGMIPPPKKFQSKEMAQVFSAQTLTRVLIKFFISQQNISPNRIG